MKISELTSERVMTCELCGRDFVAKDKSRAIRCPECAVVIRKGNKQEGFRHQQLFEPRKMRVSNLDTLVREAKKYGLSYGQYVSLKAAGYKVKQRNRTEGINPAWQEWKEKMYATVAACRARAENHGE
jgi:ribosomal protein L37AE/L43A